jgi:hypothetical protein
VTIIPIKVGWDYDEPICKWYDLAHKASLEAGIALPHHEPTSWAPHETYGVTLEEWVRVLDDEVLKGDGGMYGAPLDDHTKWQLHRVADMGFENHIITARGSFGQLGDLVKELTLRQIEREGLPVTSVTFNRDKVGVVNELGLDYMIDDAPHNYEPIVAGCPNTETYLLDERWNRDLVVPEGRRLFSVEEYVDIILSKHARVLVR